MTPDVVMGWVVPVVVFILFILPATILVGAFAWFVVTAMIDEMRDGFNKSPKLNQKQSKKLAKLAEQSGVKPEVILDEALWKYEQGLFIGDPELVEFRKEERDGNDKSRVH